MPRGFPSPVGVVGDRIRVWPWAVVLEWSNKVLGLELVEDAVPPLSAAVLDVSFATHRSPQLGSALRRGWAHVVAEPGRGRRKDIATSAPPRECLPEERHRYEQGDSKMTIAGAVPSTTEPGLDGAPPSQLYPGTMTGPEAARLLGVSKMFSRSLPRVKRRSPHPL